MTKLGGKQIVVLGGGLSGLSYLHYLRTFAVALNKTDQIKRITLLEANDYMGGSIKSRIHDDGIIHELGPRSVRNMGMKANNTVVLLEQLGLGDAVMKITPKSAAGQDRYIYNKGKLHKVNLSMTKLFTRLPASSQRLGGILIRELFKPAMKVDDFPEKDPSLYDFIKYRFGEEAAENVLDPLLRGITAGDARNLSTRSLAGDIFSREQVYGSIVKGVFKPPVAKLEHDELFTNDLLKSGLLKKFKDDRVLSYNLKTGLQTLTEHLSNSLLNTNEDGVISIYNRTKAQSINFESVPRVDNDFDEAPCSVSVRTIDGDEISIPADHIVAAIPSKNLAELLPDSMQAHERETFEDIIKIPHVPVGCVVVEYRNLKNALPKEVNSFGFLTHSKSGSRVLGISFDSSMFPEIDKPLGSTRMTCMIGGAWFKEVVGTSNLDQVTDSHLEQIALDEIRKILKIECEPFRTTSLLWKTGIAQYVPGHNARLERARASIKQHGIPLTLIGQSYDGVAVNDVTFGARMAAYNFIKSL